MSETLEPRSVEQFSSLQPNPLVFRDRRIADLETIYNSLQRAKTANRKMLVAQEPLFRTLLRRGSNNFHFVEFNMS